MNTTYPIRIYISCNQLVNTRASLNLLLSRIRQSKLHHCDIVIAHSADWDFQYDVHDLNLQFHNTDYTSQHFEFPALLKVLQDSQHDEFFGLYLHCKGSSKTDSAEWDNCVAWAEYMLYGVLDHSDQCLYHLQQGCDLVGSQWHWHFKGNFYWFRSDYVRQLVDPMLMDQDYRFNCEFWPAYSFWWGRYSLPKVKNLFYMQNLHADTDYLILKHQRYVPSLNTKTVHTGSFAEFVQTQWAGAFDVILVNNAEMHNYHAVFAKYLNYDGVIINTDTGETHEANHFLY